MAAISAKERIIFCLSESKYEEEDYSTGIRYRPDFVAIKIGPEANPPSLVTIEREVTDVPLSKQDHELAWSQLETTGGIYSQGAASAVQSASYTGTSSKLGLTSFRWWAYSSTPSGPSFGSTSPMPGGSAKQRPLISILEIPSLCSRPTFAVSTTLRPVLISNGVAIFRASPLSPSTRTHANNSRVAFSYV
jgi:hypothetical protein